MLVDRIVWAQGDIPFNKEYKHQLLSLLSEDISYQGQHMITTTAIPRYVLNALRNTFVLDKTGMKVW